MTWIFVPFSSRDVLVSCRSRIWPTARFECSWRLLIEYWWRRAPIGRMSRVACLGEINSLSPILNTSRAPWLFFKRLFKAYPTRPTCVHQRCSSWDIKQSCNWPSFNDCCSFCMTNFSNICADMLYFYFLLIFLHTRSCVWGSEYRVANQRVGGQHSFPGVGGHVSVFEHSCDVGDSAKRVSSNSNTSFRRPSHAAESAHFEISPTHDWIFFLVCSGRFGCVLGDQQHSLHGHYRGYQRVLQEKPCRRVQDRSRLTGEQPTECLQQPCVGIYVSWQEFFLYFLQ